MKSWSFLKQISLQKIFRRNGSGYAPPIVCREEKRSGEEATRKNVGSDWEKLSPDLPRVLLQAP
jgi:hypothetical protein